MNGVPNIPLPQNEPVRGYAPGSPERASLRAELARQSALEVEAAPIVAGKAIHTGDTSPMVMPHAHQHRLGVFHKAHREHVLAAIEAAEAARPAWAALPWEQRASVFLRAAALLRGPWRDRLNAATMLGQSKTAHQAEIDAACELIDFWTFNVQFLTEIMADQPLSPSGNWNRLEYRPLDGFVLAISPFNFTSIAGNLPTAPALCGNTVVWKPASTSVLSGHVIMELLHEAGLPPGVINFVPGSGGGVVDPILADHRLAGVHFTGSTDVFNGVWRTVGENVARYRQYPRLVGETGGKDFVLVHESADIDTVVAALLRGAFEYQGQKCSAASRAYVPDTLWPMIRAGLGDGLAQIQVGDVADFRNFMGAVIDDRAYRKLTGAVQEAKASVGRGVQEVLGGAADDREGWFLGPTVVVATDPRYRTMTEELFGPVLTVHVYPTGSAARFAETLELVDSTSPYALTGAVFARDRAAVHQACERLRHAAGNFYVNDKPTGAVVGQQPFGGSRASGTNDKAGSAQNLQRWLSTRTIKENFDPPRRFQYPFMDEA